MTSNTFYNFCVNIFNRLVYPRCKYCGKRLTHENSVVLLNGEYFHYECPKRAEIKRHEW